MHTHKTLQYFICTIATSILFLSAYTVCAGTPSNNTIKKQVLEHPRDTALLHTFWLQCYQAKDYDNFLSTYNDIMVRVSFPRLAQKPWLDAILHEQSHVHNMQNVCYLYFYEARIHLVYLNDATSFGLCTKSLELAKKTGLNTQLFLAYSNFISYYEEIQFNPIRAQENLQLMEDCFDKMTDADKVRYYKMRYISSSIFYYYIQDYRKSAYYLDNGYRFASVHHDTANVLEFLKRRAYYETELKEYNKALKTIDTACTYIRPGGGLEVYTDKLNSRRFIILNRYGRTQEAYTLYQRINTANLETIEYYNHLYETVGMYVNLGQYDEAQTVLNKLVPLVKNKNVDYAAGCNYLQYEIYKGKSQWQQALTSYELYKKANDSLQNVSRQITAYTSEIKYQADKKEQELKLREAELKAERQNRIFIAFALTIIILLLLIIIGFIFLRSLRQKEQLQKKFSEEMIEHTEKIYERVSSEIHDELGQDVALLRYTLNDENYQESKKLTIRVIEKVRSISRELYPAVLKHLGLKEALNALLERIDKTSAVFINHEINYQGGLDKDTELQIYRIIQEALTNAIKHSGAMAIQFAINADNKYFYAHIRDNGKGFDVKATNRSRDIFGLMNMQHRAELIGYKISIESSLGKGTLIKLQGHIAASDSAHDRQPENNNR